MTNLIAQADMTTILAFLACLARLFRPSQASHASPYGRVSGVLFELRRARSRRVRRYVSAPLALEPAPVIPAPRKPVDTVPTLPPLALRPVPTDYVPIVDPCDVEPPAAMVRGPYVAFERAQEQRRIDRDRLGVAVLRDIATAAQVTA